MSNIKSKLKAMAPAGVKKHLYMRRFKNETSGPAAGSPLAGIVETVSQQKFSADERAAIDRIEALRERTNRDETPLVFTDFGAGAETDTRSSGEMSSGSSETETVGEVCRTRSKPPIWAQFLFQLVRETKPQSCIEMGTCLGISASYLGAALKLNGSGKLVTLEGAPSIADFARGQLNSLDLDNVAVVTGQFSDTLASTLEALKPVDFVFVDGHHDGPATIEYFQQIRPYLSENAVMVFDDISWSPGMRAAWEEIAREDLDAYDFTNLGVCMNIKP